MPEYNTKDDNFVNIQKKEFPGIIFVYNGSLTVEAVSYGGATHVLEILYSNCAYGIYHAAQKLMKKDEVFIVTHPVQIKPIFTSRLYLLP